MERRHMRRSRGVKPLALVLALVLVVGCAVGGTLAWLTAESSEVKNVFTTSDIGVKLEETKGNEGADGTKAFKMVPGWTIAKDPKATVTTGSEDCYLFVKVEKSENFNNFMEYEIADGWTALKDVDGVYYMIFDSKDDENTNKKGEAYSILDGDEVTVKKNVTKANMNGLTADDDYPTLTFTAYAVQLYKDNDTQFTAAKAWEIAAKLETTTNS